MILRQIDATRRFRIALAFSVALCAAVAIFITNCRHDGRRGPSAPTQVDRLMQAYPELRSGRIAVIADFENEAHYELFRLDDASPDGRYTRNPTGGRRATGIACVSFIASSPRDVIVVNNDTASAWYLKRDWRPYDLLMVSLHAPRKSLCATIIVVAGPPSSRRSVETSLPLQPGWNTVRLDLGELGEHLSLDDVREIRFAVSDATAADDAVFQRSAELLIDDIILTGNREDLFGVSDAKDGALYVQRIGRRWHVGAAGRFELTFGNGQIAEWFNLADDPYRLRNLVRGTTLSPMPTALFGTKSTREAPGSIGEALSVRTAFIEMNRVRVVVRTEWQRVGNPSAPRGDQAFVRWDYTIYPTGQIYVAMVGSHADHSPASAISIDVAWTEEEAGGAETHITPPPASDSDGASVAYARFVHGGANASLVMVPARSHQPAALSIEHVTEQGRLSIIAEATDESANPLRWAVLLRLGKSTDGAKQAALRSAQQYTRAPAIRLDIGSAGEQAKTCGFDPASGCYVLTPEENRIRLRIQAHRKPYASPAFRILHTKALDAWVYVDNLVLDRVARDANGDLIFQLPGILTKETLVEVLLQPRGRAESDDL